MRCSGKSWKFALIISNVHSNTASNITGTSAVTWFSSLLMKTVMVLSTSESLALGWFLL